MANEILFVCLSVVSIYARTGTSSRRNTATGPAPMIPAASLSSDLQQRLQHNHNMNPRRAGSNMNQFHHHHHQSSSTCSSFSSSSFSATPHGSGNQGHLISDSPANGEEGDGDPSLNVSSQRRQQQLQQYAEEQERSPQQHIYQVCVGSLKRGADDGCGRDIFYFVLTCATSTKNWIQVPFSDTSSRSGTVFSSPEPCSGASSNRPSQSSGKS